MFVPTEVRQRPSGGLILTYPLEEDIMTSMLNGTVLRVKKGALDASIAAIRAGEQGFTVLWGNDYNSPVGTVSNDSARVALTSAALIVTLRRYLDTPASRIVQSLIGDRVKMGVGLGIAVLKGDSETFQGPDGREWTRNTVSEGAACEGRIRLQDSPRTMVVSRRYL